MPPRIDRLRSCASSACAKDLYNPAFNNCEHFVEWCITGKYKSQQVDIVMVSVVRVFETVSGAN
ncbi:MAG: lecithin retinol acyltransferase family protein [Rhodoplanes sp.]